MLEKTGRKIMNLLRIPLVFKNWPRVYGNLYREFAAGGSGQTGVLELRSGGRLTVRLRGDFLDIGSVLDIFGAGVYVGELDTPDGAVVLDIGASIGDFSVYCGLHIPGSRVIAYEVDPDAYAILEDNIRDNGLSGRVIPYQKAVAGSPGSIIINGIECEAVTLEGILKENSVDRCSLCKIDIEGMEYDVLLGSGRDVLRRIGNMVIECHNCTGNNRFGDLKSCLLDSGFSVRPTRINAYDACLLYCSREGLR